MYLKEFSPWGVLPIVFLLCVVIAILWLVDRRMMRRAGSIALNIPRLPVKLRLPVVVALVAGTAASAGILVLTMPCRAFWPLCVAMLLLLLKTVPWAMTVYMRSLMHTAAHRRYLLANGATHLESLIPSVRRALRTAVMPLLGHRSSAMPLAVAMLVLGAWAGGATVVSAVAVGVLVWAVAIVAAVLTSMLAMWMADRIIFDSHENLKKLFPR